MGEMLGSLQGEVNENGTLLASAADYGPEPLERSPAHGLAEPAVDALFA